MSNTITGKLFNGLFYITIGKYTGFVLSLVIAGILSRILHPSDFGVMSLATICIGFFSIFSDLGIGVAIIQNKELNDRNYSELFSFLVITGILLSLGVVGFSYIYGHFYHSDELISLCKWLSVSLFFNAINTIPNGLLYKEKEFKFLAIRNIGIQLAGGALGIAAAYYGLGVYALAVQPVFTSVASFILCYARKPIKPSYRFTRDTFQRIFTYSFFQLLFNIINFVSRNVDNLLTGKYLGLKELGYYDKSYRLMMLPLENVSSLLSSVIHPVFSDYQDQKEMQILYYEKIVKLLAFIGFPLSIFLYFAADDLIITIFGPQWEPSVPIFRILSIIVGLQMVLSSSGSIFQATNETRILFISGLISTICNVTAISIGVFYFKSLTALAWGLVISISINFIQCYLLLYIYNFKRKIIFFIRQLKMPAELSIYVLLTLFLINKTIHSEIHLLNLFLYLFATIIILAIYILFRKPIDLNNLKKSLKSNDK
ncbi:MAG: lipopolysaccharide biosynthesis protein [Bacteroidales bacterium]